jgi:hypothetical protein
VSPPQEKPLPRHPYALKALLDEIQAWLPSMEADLFEWRSEAEHLEERINSDATATDPSCPPEPSWRSLEVLPSAVLEFINAPLFRKRVQRMRDVASHEAGNDPGQRLAKTKRSFAAQNEVLDSFRELRRRIIEKLDQSQLVPAVVALSQSAGATVPEQETPGDTLPTKLPSGERTRTETSRTNRSAKKQKRSTERGEGRAKLVGALTQGQRELCAVYTR